MKSNLFRLDGGDIDLCEIINGLCKSIENVEEINWYEGEYLECECTLGDFLVGAYWAFTECHEGQYSLSYETLCCIGNIYNPGMACGPESDSEITAYKQVIEYLMKI